MAKNIFEFFPLYCSQTAVALQGGRPQWHCKGVGRSATARGSAAVALQGGRTALGGTILGWHLFMMMWSKFLSKTS